jgi:hypothetical protein
MALISGTNISIEISQFLSYFGNEFSFFTLVCCWCRVCTSFFTVRGCKRCFRYTWCTHLQDQNTEGEYPCVQTSRGKGLGGVTNVGQQGSVKETANKIFKIIKGIPKWSPVKEVTWQIFLISSAVGQEVHNVRGRLFLSLLCPLAQHPH